MDQIGDFVHAALPVRVVFGAGRIDQLGAELERLGVRRALFACTPRGPQRYARIIAGLGERCVGVFDGAEPHNPEPVAEAALAAFKERDADGIVTVGGGSTVALGKWVTVATGMPYLAVPTTLSGSEMTAIYGVKVGNQKRTQRNSQAMARTVIYDPALTLGLPAHETATTGMNSLAHCVEALYPAEPNPIATIIAREALAALRDGLPASIERPGDLAARSRALYGGFLGGLLVQLVGIGLHHKICHVLGGRFGVPHGEANSVVLPQVAAFNAPAMPEATALLREVFGSDNPAAAIFDPPGEIDAPVSLKALGIDRDGIEDAADEIIPQVAYNPRPLTRDGVARLLISAYDGTRPA